MKTAQESIRHFLTTEISVEELRHMNGKYNLGLEPGTTYLDALAARAAQMAAESRQWAEVVQKLDGIKGGGAGD